GDVGLSSSNPPCRLALEQPLWAKHQHCCHDQIDHEQFGLRHEMHRSSTRQPNQNRADCGALDTAQPSDHDDREAQDDDVRTEARLHRYFRRGQGAGEGGEQDTEREGDRIDAVDAYAHAHAHFFIVYDGEHDLADHGTIEAEPDRKADHGRNRYQHQIVANVIEPGEFEIAEQLIWLRCIDRIDAPDQLGDVFKDQKHGIG